MENMYSHLFIPKKTTQWANENKQLEPQADAELEQFLEMRIQNLELIERGTWHAFGEVAGGVVKTKPGGWE